MNQSELRQALDNLQLELLKLGPVDAETQEKVDALLTKLKEIDELPESEEDQESLTMLLEDSVTSLETSHPTVTDLMNHVMSLLSSIGI